MRSWPEEQKVRKWRWAGHLARQGPDKWSTRLWEWRPEGKRWRKGKPTARWEDELAEYAQKELGGKEHWILLAACKEAWRKEGKKFAKERPEEDEEEEGE